MVNKNIFVLDEHLNNTSYPSLLPSYSTIEAETISSKAITRKKNTPSVVVLGGSFAGLTAAFEIKHKLKDKVDVTVTQKIYLFHMLLHLVRLTGQ